MAIRMTVELTYNNGLQSTLDLVVSQASEIEETRDMIEHALLVSPMSQEYAANILKGVVYQSEQEEALSTVPMYTAASLANLLNYQITVQPINKEGELSLELARIEQEKQSTSD